LQDWDPGAKGEPELKESKMEDLRYPMGKFQMPEIVTPQIREGWIRSIADTPGLLIKNTVGLSDEQLGMRYRPDGWTVLQVIHHLADSHMNAYVRFKLALTEDSPTVKTYEESLWAELPDGKNSPPEDSIQLLSALHRRWENMLRAMQPADFEKTFNHPEMGLVPLERSLAIYAWHGRHHVAQIQSLRTRMSWV
jgi:hypothetical protein